LKEGSIRQYFNEEINLLDGKEGIANDIQVINNFLFNPPQLRLNNTGEVTSVISMLCGNTSYRVKSSGENLSRYSSKIEWFKKMSVLSSLSY